MGRFKFRHRKKRLIKKGRITNAPLWASIKKFGLKRARTRRIWSFQQKHWRRDSKKE